MAYKCPEVSVKALGSLLRPSGGLRKRHLRVLHDRGPPVAAHDRSLEQEFLGFFSFRGVKEEKDLGRGSFGAQGRPLRGSRPFKGPWGSESDCDVSYNNARI